ncbi:MAG: ATP-binding protein [Polyangiaceae bacterium]
MHSLLERQLRKLGIDAAPPDADQWARFLARVDVVYTDADRDRYTLERALDLSSGEMRKRFTELRDAQKQLIAASRKAGMADVATSVLHNIGNVLNSVNTSATLVADLARSSSRAGLGKCLALLDAQARPGAFIDEDPKGKRLIPYLHALDKTFHEESESMLREVQSLAKSIEHIKQIVTQQLAMAKGDAASRNVIQRVDLSELFQDVVTVLGSTLPPSPPIQVVRELQTTAIETDHHKVFQIVLNLMTNARDALASQPGGGTITLSARPLPEDKVAIEVRDDGAGIAKENIERIFGHGFTTKSDGHGFGLHSSACAAIELGGVLRATSDGVGCGATFTLTLPSGVVGRRTGPHRAQPQKVESAP